MSAESKKTRWMFAALIVGVVVGQILHDVSWQSHQLTSEHSHGSLISLFDFVGFSIFMGLLKMLIVPLISASVLTAVTSVGDFGKLGRLGGWTIVYYFSTMFIAVIVGLLLVVAIAPGQGLSGIAGAADQAPHLAETIAHVEQSGEGGLRAVFENLIGLMVPENIFKAMAEGQTLSIIVFFIFFGAVVTALGEKGRVINSLAQAVTDVLMKMVDVVLLLAPAGVFCLLAGSIARIGLGVFGQAIGSYMFVVLLGLLIHGLIILPGILWMCTKTNPFSYLFAMRAALFTALGTSSSSATLPVSIECATTGGGVTQKAAGLVLPLGATVNMDGTALYEGVAVVFLAQVSGIVLGPVQLLLIAVTATLSAVGAAGIPSAGLVTMFVVVDAVNHSLLAADSSAALIPIAGISLIIGVDRLLDMVRTTVNVWGDAVGAKIISALDR